MPILSTALQTLSEMAIHESSVEIPQETTPNIVQELLEMLDNTPSLTREECIYEERFIPIKKSQRLGYYLIEMEDLSRYMMTAGIQSISEAIGNILSVNNLEGQYHRVAIVIDEHSILDEIATLGYEADSSTWTKKPRAGLGMPLVGNSHEDFKDFRKIANTAELLNVITNRYGLPVVKKNYEMVGLLKSSNSSGSMSESFDYVDEQQSFGDDVKLRNTEGKVVLQEKPKSSKEKYVVDEDHEASREEQPGDIDSMQEGKLWNRIKDIPDYIRNNKGRIAAKFGGAALGALAGSKLGGKENGAVGATLGALAGRSLAQRAYNAATGNNKYAIDNRSNGYKTNREKIYLYDKEHPSIVESSEQITYDNTEESLQESYIQHLRDIAAGKYDDMI